MVLFSQFSIHTKKIKFVTQCLQGRREEFGARVEEDRESEIFYILYGRWAFLFLESELKERSIVAMKLEVYRIFAVLWHGCVWKEIL